MPTLRKLLSRSLGSRSSRPTTAIALALSIGTALGATPSARAQAPAKLSLPRAKVAEIEKLADAWFAARPKSLFAEWDGAQRAALEQRARAVGEIGEGDLAPLVELLWKAAGKHAPDWKKLELPTPYGPATFLQKGKGGRKQGFALALHGGGEGAGDAGEALGNWSPPGCLIAAPQGIRLVHDTWNTVHGERFALSLIEWAKWRHDVDPDRIYAMGFSMGGTGSFFLAGRHPDLLAGAIPAHGVLMAEPKSQLASKAEVVQVQHGLLPNLRNLAMYWYTGDVDRNCMPGTYLFAWDRLLELREADPGGYAKLAFYCQPNQAHSFPPGEPQKGFDVVLKERRDAFPSKLVWEHASDPFPQPDSDEPLPRLVPTWHYWLRCLAPQDRMRITATRDGNRFAITTKGIGAEKLELLLQPALYDPKQPLVVTVDGRKVVDGVALPDFWTVLETLDARMDRTLVFDRRVRLSAGR